MLRLIEKSDACNVLNLWPKKRRFSCSVFMWVNPLVSVCTSVLIKGCALFVKKATVNALPIFTLWQIDGP